VKLILKKVKAHLVGLEEIRMKEKIKCTNCGQECFDDVSPEVVFSDKKNIICEECSIDFEMIGDKVVERKINNLINNLCENQKGNVMENDIIRVIEDGIRDDFWREGIDYEEYNIDIITDEATLKLTVGDKRFIIRVEEEN